MAKNLKIILFVASLFLLALLVYGAELILYENKNLGAIKFKSPIASFEECAAAGYPILESYPEQCRTADGRMFVRELSEAEKKNSQPPAENCQNLCGNGVCQEVVCSAIGCPCPETAENCSADCGGTAPGSLPGDVGLANPASVNCVRLGGRVDLRSDLSGGQLGYCVFKNGQECEEWALMRNECTLSPDSRMGTLKGRVSIGPICPVESVDQSCQAPAEAYTSREVIVYRADGATEVARQSFGADGSFNFLLVPGVYILNLPAQAVGGSPDLPQTVIVRGGETLELNFSIDTGIR